MAPWVYTFIAISVTVIWVIANLRGFLSGDAIDPQIHYVMGGVVGAALGGQALANRDRRNEMDSDLAHRKMDREE